jgi:hypothetical protein
MKKWLSRVIVAGVLAALGLWGWRVVFPSPEEIIRKRLDELAKAASFSSGEGLLAKAWNASSLGEFFTLDVQVTVDVPGTQHTISGRDELLQAAVGARSEVGSLSIEFPDIKVTVAPDKNSAVVYLTAKGKASGQTDFYLQELRLRMTRIKRDWLIDQIETVKTLSQRAVPGISCCVVSGISRVTSPAPPGCSAGLEVCATSPCFHQRALISHLCGRPWGPLAALRPRRPPLLRRAAHLSLPPLWRGPG